MSRGFYTPIHSALYSGAFGANPKAYSLPGLSSSNNSNTNGTSSSSSGGGSFGYPPTPPKDSGTPDQLNAMNNNNNVNGESGGDYGVQGSSTPDLGVGKSGSSMDIKQEYFNSISTINQQLSSYANSSPYSANVGRKLEGGSSGYISGSAAGQSSNYGGYSSSDLAMYYTSAAAARNTGHLPKSKAKTRTNAGRTIMFIFLHC